MKKLILIFFIVNFSLLNDNCFSLWVQISSGMGNLTVSALSIEGNNLFAGGTSSGVYASTNGGNNWSQTSLNSQIVFSLVNKTNNVVAGTFNAGAYYSTNNGANWNQVTMGGNMTVWALAYSGTNLFAGTFCPVIANMGVYLSTNNGVSWVQVGVNNREVRSIAAANNYVYAGTIDSGVFISSNSGANWIKSSLNNKNVRSVAVNGNNVFAGCLNAIGVYSSTDNGLNWLQTSLNNRDVGSIAVSGINVIAGTVVNGVYVSNDNGVTWIQRNEGLGSLSINALCIFNGIIYAGTISNGVYKRPLSEVLGIQPVSSEIPAKFSLSQNYPNPFNPSTKISFSIPLLRGVSEGRGVFTFLSVYDILGREVAVLVNEALKPGTYEVDFNASNYPSGVYYYNLHVGDFTETKKMILVK